MLIGAFVFLRRPHRELSLWYIVLGCPPSLPVRGRGWSQSSAPLGVFANVDQDVTKKTKPSHLVIYRTTVLRCTIN